METSTFPIYNSTFHCNWHLVTVCCFPPYNHLLHFGDADCQPKLGTGCLIFWDCTLSTACVQERRDSSSANRHSAIFLCSAFLSYFQNSFLFILYFSWIPTPSCSSTLVVQHSISRQVYRLNSTGAIHLKPFSTLISSRSSPSTHSSLPFQSGRNRSGWQSALVLQASSRLTT